MPKNAKYSWRFKRLAMDSVLREYAAFFRVSRYIEDTRTLFLLSMCAMLDLAESHHKLLAENGDIGNEVAESLSSAGPWDLDWLSREDKRFFSHANWPGNHGSLNEEQCYQRMLMVLRDAPFI